MEDGIIVGGRAGPGQKGGSLVSVARFKDFELEVDFMLAEQPAAPDGSCTTCTYNSGVYLRTGYQVSGVARRESSLASSSTVCIPKPSEETSSGSTRATRSSLISARRKIGTMSRSPSRA